MKVVGIVKKWNLEYFDIKVEVMKFLGKVNEFMFKLEVDVKVGIVFCLV